MSTLRIKDENGNWIPVPFLTPIPDESDPTVPAHVKNITEENISTWNNKSDFSGNYEDLDNKPTIPSEYKLPIASSTVLGGIKVGANLTITEDGTLNAIGGGGVSEDYYTKAEIDAMIGDVETILETLTTGSGV